MIKSMLGLCIGKKLLYSGYSKVDSFKFFLLVYCQIVAKKVHRFMMRPFFTKIIFAVIISLPISFNAHGGSFGENSVELNVCVPMFIERVDKKASNINILTWLPIFDSGKLSREFGNKISASLPSFRLLVSDGSEGVNPSEGKPEQNKAPGKPPESIRSNTDEIFNEVYGPALLVFSVLCPIIFAVCCEKQRT